MEDPFTSQSRIEQEMESRLRHIGTFYFPFHIMQTILFCKNGKFYGLQSAHPFFFGNFQITILSMLKSLCRLYIYNPNIPLGSETLPSIFTWAGIYLKSCSGSW